MATPRPEWFLPLMIGTLAACGPTASEQREREAELLSGTQAAAIDCSVEERPAVLPHASVLMDSAAVVAGVGELAAGLTEGGEGYVLLTLAFDTAGANMRREVIEHSTLPLVADSVQSLVFQSLRELDSADQEWGVRLRVELGDPVRLQVGRREFCPAVPLEHSLEQAMAGFNPAGIRYRNGRRERVLQMRVVLDEGGFVRSASIERGGFGGSSLERQISQFLKQFRFRPATVDGFPVSSVVRVPVPVRG